jgi:hypothetical protein
VAQLAQQVVGGAAGDPAVPVGAGELPGVGVHAQELGVVVQHLLEVGHQPAPVGRVAVEAAAELVEDAAGGHPVHGQLGHAERPLEAAQVAAEEELQRHRLGELRRLAEAAPGRVERLAQPLERLPQHGLVGQAVRLRAERRGLPGDELDQLGALLAGVLAAPGPGVGHRQQHPAEARHPRPVELWEVGAGVEGAALRGQEHRHRPAALAGHRLHRVHVDAVQVGALLAVDLDADEVLVHHRGRLGVLERLVRHHVAPVAGGVADRQQDRLVLLAGPLQRLRPPRVPVDGVPGVLQQVRAGLLDQPVGLWPLLHGCPV